MVRRDIRSCRLVRLALLALVVPAFWGSAALAQPSSGGQLPRAPEAGSPRPWEAGMQVARHSVVNLYTGNMLTVIPIFSCDPVGPVLEFTLYHNSSSANSVSFDPAPWGFDLGGGWSVSYGAALIEEISGDVTLVEDDGNEWLFEEDSGDYIAPAGRYDILEADTPSSGEWTLTARDQSKRIFNSDGFLVQVIDSAGNVLEIVRTDDRLDEIRSAAHIEEEQDHFLSFTYDGNDRLTTITDVIGREYQFEYESSSPYRLERVIFPKEDGDPPVTTEIEFAYDASNRIDACTDQLGGEWEFTYDINHRLTGVEDPEVNSTSNTQVFEYPGTQVNSLWRTLYTDRREEDWEYRFDTSGNFRERIDPLTNTRGYTYDGDHNRLTFTNELANTWTMTYGTNGTLETVTSPLDVEPAQTWEYDWEHNVDSIANFSRLLSVTDPAGHWVEYEYDETDPIDPTKVVLIREMDPDGGGPGTESVTTLEYYDTANALGQVKLVTDDNGVEHLYAYDSYGYWSSLIEGITEEGQDIYPTVLGGENDPAGQVTGGSDDAGGSDQTNDDAGNMNSNTCWLPLSGPTPRLGASLAPAIVPFQTCSSGNTFNDIGQPTLLNASCLEAPFGENQRQIAIDYDPLGRVTEYSVETDEQNTPRVSGKTFTRGFTDFEYDEEGRVLSVDGPDGQTTVRTYDELGRLESVVRGLMKAEYVYDDAGRLERMDTSHNSTLMTKTFYEYDEANRLLEIRVENSAVDVLHQTLYEWTVNDLVEERTEYDSIANETTTVTFGYDARDRLISEVRGGPNDYDLAYDYDGLGNRLVKRDETDPQNIVETRYFYDSDPDNRDENFVTNNNRLLWYEVYDNVGEQEEALLRIVKYTYYKTGHVSNITIIDTAEPETCADLALYYARNGTLWLAIWGEFEVDQEGPIAESYVITDVREFRYDNPRARYMSRQLDPSSDPDDASTWVPVKPAAWTDYSGVTPYGDIDVDGDGSGNAIITEHARYAAGMGAFARQTLDSGQPDETRYLHGDLIRSTVLTSDEAGDAATAVAYTAFGEIIGASGPGSPAPAGFPRYGYAGGWGYESDLLVLEGADTNLPPVTLQHVGARWYDPSIGRFVMRDPIGLMGGANVYVYASNSPTHATDPEGLTSSLPPPHLPPWHPLYPGPPNPVRNFWVDPRPLPVRPPVILPPIQSFRPTFRPTVGPVGLTIGVACVSFWAGRQVDNWYASENQGFSISDGLADLIYTWLWEDDSVSYDPWGI